MVPGSDGAISNEKEGRKLATQISYPIIIKAAAGVGDKGMRLFFYQLLVVALLFIFRESIIRILNVYWIDFGVPEAIWELQVEKFESLIVIVDLQGGNLYEQVKSKIRHQYRI